MTQSSHSQKGKNLLTKLEHIPWKRLSIEAAAIVTSILLAFAIDAWWDELSDRTAENQYLAALRQDIQATRVELDNQIEFVSRIMRRVDRVLELVSSNDGPQLPDDFSKAVGDAYGIRQPNFITSTYQDMVNSGNLRLVRNEETRLAMADLIELLDEVDYQALLINETYWTHHATFSDKNLVVSDFGWFSASNNDFNTEWAAIFGNTPQSKFDIDIEAVRSKEFWNLMFDWKVMYADQLGPLLEARNRCEELLKLIADQIDIEGR